MRKKHKLNISLSAAGNEFPDTTLSSIEMYVRLGVVIAMGLTGWLWWGILVPAPHVNTISQLDVGQGDATLISLTTSDRTQNIHILVDAGSNRSILHALGATLDPTTHYIDLAIITHADLDHFGGFVYVLERYAVGAVITNGIDSTDPAYTELMALLRKQAIPIIELSAGDRIGYGMHTLAILSPDETTDPPTDNEASLVTLLATGAPAGTYRALLTADIGTVTEERLLQKEYNLSADILKVGHHGSRFSTSEQFVAAVHPRVALIGVGQNRYGHPAESVLDILALSGADIYRTDVDGTIIFSLEDDSRFLPNPPPNDSNTFLTSVRSILTGSYAKKNTTVHSLAGTSSHAFNLVPYKTCSYTTNQTPARSPVVLNEIAWMGSPESSSHEWIELSNQLDEPVDLSGWQLINKNERIHVTLPQQTVIDAFAVIARDGADSALHLNAVTPMSGALRNTNEGVRLFDANCTLIDAVSAEPSWPAGDNASKRTMMRSTSGSWESSKAPGGTPGKLNDVFVTSSRTVEQALSPLPPTQSIPDTRLTGPTGCPRSGININTASMNELTELRHIGPTRARDIIATRPFSSIEDLVRVRGLGGSRLLDILAEGRACVE